MTDTRNDYITAYCTMEQRTSFQLLTQRHLPTVSVSELLRCNKQNRIPSGSYFRVVGVVTIVEGGYLSGGGDDEPAGDEGFDFSSREEPKLFLIDPTPVTNYTHTSSSAPDVASTSQQGQAAMRQKSIVKSEPVHDDDYYNHGEEEVGEESSNLPLQMCEVDCTASIQRKVVQLLKYTPVTSQQFEVLPSPPGGEGRGAEQLHYSLYDEDDPRGGAEMKQQPNSARTETQQPLNTPSLESETRDELFCQLDGNIVEIIARVDDRSSTMGWGEEDVMKVVSHAVRVLPSTSYPQYFKSARDAQASMFQMTARMLSENPFQIIQPFRSMTDKKRITAAVADSGGMDQLVKEVTNTAVEYGVSRRESAVPSFSPTGKVRQRLGANATATVSSPWVALVDGELSRGASTTIPHVSSSKIERDIKDTLESHALREKKPPTDFLALAQQQQQHSTPRRAVPVTAITAVNEEDECDYRLAPVEGVNPADSPVVFTWKSLGCRELVTNNEELANESAAPPPFVPPPTLSGKALRKALI